MSIGRRWFWIALLSIACDGGGNGEAATDEADPFDGVAEGEPEGPRAGLFEGDPISLRVEDGEVTELDLNLSCTCDGQDEVLDGRIRESVGLQADGYRLRPVVNSQSELRIEGAFVDDEYIVGTYAFRCCTEGTWSARWTDEAAGSSEACTGTPPGSPIPAGRTNDGKTLHWGSPSTCIAVSFASDLGDLRDRIAAAAQAWTDVDCSAICFETPSAAETGPTAMTDRRVHFQRPDATHTIPGAAPAQTTSLVNGASGEIVGATIALSDAVIDGDSKNELLRQLGRALGFDQAPSGLASVLGASGGGESLTENDEAALCALYGDPPFCAE